MCSKTSQHISCMVPVLGAPEVSRQQMMGPISAAGRISILAVTRVGSPCNHPAQAQNRSLIKPACRKQHP